MITLEELILLKSTVTKSISVEVKLRNELDFLFEKHKIEYNEQDLINNLIDETLELNFSRGYEQGSDDFKDNLNESLDKNNAVILDQLTTLLEKFKSDILNNISGDMIKIYSRKIEDILQDRLTSDNLL